MAKKQTEYRNEYSRVQEQAISKSLSKRPKQSPEEVTAQYNRRNQSPPTFPPNAQNEHKDSKKD